MNTPGHRFVKHGVDLLNIKWISKTWTRNLTNTFVVCWYILGDNALGEKMLLKISRLFSKVFCF